MYHAQQRVTRQSLSPEQQHQFRTYPLQQVPSSDFDWETAEYDSETEETSSGILYSSKKNKSITNWQLKNLKLGIYTT